MTPEETERAREREFYLRRYACGIAARVLGMTGGLSFLYGVDEHRVVLDQLSERLRELSKEESQDLFTHAWEGILMGRYP